MTILQKLQLKQSEIREKLNSLLGLETRTEDQDKELTTLTAEGQKIEPEIRAAIIAAPDPEEVTTATVDPETRERLELRSKARLNDFLRARIRGQFATGATGEYAEAVGITDGSIPLDLFQPSPEQRAVLETRAITPPPAAGTGVRLRPIQPFVFADGLAGLIGIEMPTVESGQFSTATITTALQATAKAKGGDADDTAAELTAVTSGVKRISASLTVAAEDEASVGVDNFEAALSAHMQLALQNAHDGFALTGNGVAPNPKGILTALGADAARAALETFGSYAAVPADAVEGTFASETTDVLILCGTQTLTHAAKTFQANTAVSASGYLRAEAAGFRASSRFAAPAANVQQALAVRRGRPGIQVAVQPVWNRIVIDDIYTLSASAQRKVVMHVLLGDVIVQQAGAFKRIAFKLA